MAFNFNYNLFLEKSSKPIISLCLVIIVVSLALKFSTPQLMELFGKNRATTQLDNSYVTIEVLTEKLSENKEIYQMSFDDLSDRIDVLEREKNRLEVEKIVLEERLKESHTQNRLLTDEICKLNDRNILLKNEIGKLNERIDVLDQTINSLK